MCNKFEKEDEKPLMLNIRPVGRADGHNGCFREKCYLCVSNKMYFVGKCEVVCVAILNYSLIKVWKS